jgi:hypothetical protein
MKFEWDFSELGKFAQHLNNVNLNHTFQRIAREISIKLLESMKQLTPRDKKGILIAGWNGNDFLVQPWKNGYRVDIVNKAPYAYHVNDGHQAYNQFGGPYPINRRVKVKQPYKWQSGDSTYYVFGHFFVERGILQLKNTNEIENIILRELHKWWDSV